VLPGKKGGAAMANSSKYAEQLRGLGFKEYVGPGDVELSEYEVSLVIETGEEIPTDIETISEEMVTTLPCFWIIEFGSVAAGMPSHGITMAFDENGDGWVNESRAVRLSQLIPEFTLAEPYASR
jgi:hypothetical protein